MQGRPRFAAGRSRCKVGQYYAKVDLYACFFLGDVILYYSGFFSLRLSFVSWCCDIYTLNFQVCASSEGKLMKSNDQTKVYPSRCLHDFGQKISLLGKQKSLGAEYCTGIECSGHHFKARVYRVALYPRRFCSCWRFTVFFANRHIFLAKLLSPFSVIFRRMIGRQAGPRGVWVLASWKNKNKLNRAFIIGSEK